MGMLTSTLYFTVFCYIVSLTAVSATLAMKVLVYTAVKLIPVPNPAAGAVITRPSAPRLDLVLITVHAVMVSVVMALCALQ